MSDPHQAQNPISRSVGGGVSFASEAPNLADVDEASNVSERTVLDLRAET